MGILGCGFCGAYDEELLVKFAVKLHVVADILTGSIFFLFGCSQCSGSFTRECCPLEQREFNEKTFIIYNNI